MMDDDLEQLMLLKEMTRTTGVLHDAQVLQMKYWPLMLTHATRSEFKFNYEKAEVIFDLKETQGRQPSEWTKRLELLGLYTQNLLGGEYTVKIKLKGKQIHVKRGDADGRRTGKQTGSKGTAEPRRVEKRKQRRPATPGKGR